MLTQYIIRPFMQNWLYVGAGLLIGFIAWGPERSPALALLLPVLWMYAPNRIVATTTALCYYLLAMRGIPAISVAYFTPPWSYLYGFGLWLAVVLILTFGWLAVDLVGMRSGRRRGLGASLAILMVAVPPLGIVGAANPVLGLGWVAPGYGIWAIGSYLLILSVLPFLTTNFKLLATTGMLATLVLATLTPLAEKPYDRFSGIVAMNTMWGQFKSHGQAGDRFEEVGQQLRKVQDPTIKALIFPETSLGPWQASYDLLWEIEITGVAKRRGIEVGIGAERRNLDGSWKNSLIIQQGISRFEPFARQTLPITMYRPWDRGAFPSDWFKTNVVNIGGHKALLLFCFEEHLPWLILSSILLERPEVIVSVSNVWWGHNSVEPIVQKRHTEAISKLFDIPLVRSTNQ